MPLLHLLACGNKHIEIISWEVETVSTKAMCSMEIGTA